MRAFVTGGHGFVGAWLCRHLAASGDEVVIADLAMDVTDGAALRRALDEAQPDVVYHLAAQSSVHDSWDAPAETFRVNALGTVQVLSAVQACAPGARVVLVSSVEVYGVVPEAELPVTERSPFRPATPYAASKAAAELAGVQAHLGWGLDVIRARPFTHTGPGQTERFFVPSMACQIIEAATSGAKELHAGNLTVRRDILDVRDVVRAYRLLAERGVAGEVYNVCSGHSVPLAQIVQRLLVLAGADLRVTTDPARLRPVDLPDLRGDPRHLHEATGWQPELLLDDTLADVLDYWRHAMSPGSPTTC
jgi:GDP-4-dehydro-6-deoxy-D-mannose reductase